MTLGHFARARGRALRLLLAAASGALYFLGFAGFDLWPLSFVALVPVLWALDPDVWPTPPSTRQVLGIGFVFGLITNLGGYYWLISMLETFSGFPWALCVLFGTLLCAYQGGVLLLFAWAYTRARQARVPTTLAAITAMCAAEWLYPLLFEHYFGNSLHLVPVAIQTADLGGTLLVTALLTAANAGLFRLTLLLRGRVPAWREFGLVALAWALALAYGVYRVAEVDARAARAPKLNVGVVQTNMALLAKRDDPVEGLERHVAQSLALAGRTKLDLLVWPESAFAWFLPEGTERISNLIPVGTVLKTPLLFGGLASRKQDGKRRFYNTAFLTDAEGKLLGSYDKTYLLAFGEYIPFGEWFPALYDISPNSGRFTAGNHVRTLSLGEIRIGTLICYEDILPAFVRRMVAEGDPHLLVNITNDAWFGDTHEPWEHLALAKFRSVEHHRALVRSTNSGVSGFVDPVGRVLKHSGVFTREEFAAELPLLEGTTLYQYVGALPGWLSLLFIFWAVWRSRRERLKRSS